MTSQAYHYKKGANQQFCQISHVFDPSKHPEEDLLYNPDREIIPIAIYCVVDEGQDGMAYNILIIISLILYHCSSHTKCSEKQRSVFQCIYGAHSSTLSWGPLLSWVTSRSWATYNKCQVPLSFGQ